MKRFIAPLVGALFLAGCQSILPSLEVNPETGNYICPDGSGPSGFPYDPYSKWVCDPQAGWLWLPGYGYGYR